MEPGGDNEIVSIYIMTSFEDVNELISANLDFNPCLHARSNEVC